MDVLPKTDATQGGLGGDCALGIRDVRLLDRAIREEWDIKPEERREIIERLMMAVRKGKINTSIKAARAIISADGVNAKREAATSTQQHEHHHTGDVTFTAVRAEILNDPTILEALRNHQSDSDAGTVRAVGGPEVEIPETPEVPGPSHNGHANGNGRH